MRWSKMSLWNRAYYAADCSADCIFVALAFFVLSHFLLWLWYLGLGALLLSIGYFSAASSFRVRAEQEQAEFEQAASEQADFERKAWTAYGDGWEARN